MAVVRVDESEEAPHVYDDRYVYERTGSANKPYDLTRVDRIERLLSRRSRIVDDRERLVGQAIGRVLGLLPDPLTWPLRWLALVPVFPWRELCDPHVCRQFHDVWHEKGWGTSGVSIWSVQRVAGGSFGRGWQVFPNDERAVVACTGLNSRGMVFAAELADETYREATQSAARGQGLPYRVIGFTETRLFMERVLVAAAEFYGLKGVELPGELHLAHGFKRIRNHRMRGTAGLGLPILDDEFRADDRLSVRLLLDDPRAALGPLLEQVGFALDVPGVAAGVRGAASP